MAEEVALIGGVATDASETWGRGVASIDPAQVANELQKIRAALAPVMAGNDPATSGLSLQQLEVAVGITVGGKVGLIAEGSVEGTASITLTFAQKTGS